MKNYSNHFHKVLKSRNEAQLKAIQYIDGPVLVIAGPGTGKTDVLSLRAGHIIKETDAGAQNILCLTFTDAGAIAMRRRLLQYIGPEAYNVGIYTFHGFCNLIIQENIEIFGGYRELQLLSDLERVKVMKKMIDDLPTNHVLKRLTGDIYFESRRIKNLFSLMKQENWSHKLIDQKINNELENKKDDYRYKNTRKGYKKGDINPNKWNPFVKQMEQTRGGANLLPTYTSILFDQKRYDYQDMILWVIKAFENHPDLLAKYQERFQYMMVDEFQDSNGSQMALVDLLANFWESPNLFVVGDDDQSIYRFQGANMENILTFAAKYKPRIVVLENNYRSTQNILDCAKNLIDNNDERLIENFKGLSKDLKAHAKHGHEPIQVQLETYPNQIQEEAALVKKLHDLHTTGQIISNESVGVIYRNHKQPERIISVLEALDIPVEIKRRFDVLKDSLGRQIIQLLKYIVLENDQAFLADHLLFEIMHYRFFNIDRHDIVKIQLKYREIKLNKEVNNPHLYTLLFDDEFLDSDGLSNAQSIINFRTNIKEWQERYYEYTAQTYLEHILNFGGILNYVLTHPKRNWYLQVVNTLMDFIKNESAKDYQFTIKDCIHYFDEMLENGISLPIQKSMQTEVGVQFMTAHGAKGLEFDHVFIFDATHKKWDNPTGNNKDYKLPSELIPIQADESIQDDRRLFYVAMTRARKYLTITHAESDGNKDKLPSQFLEELLSDHATEAKKVDAPEQVVINFLTKPLMHIDQPLEWMDRALIKHIIDDYTLNATGLNKYLRCPIAFYFENILRVPSARTASMGFGNAIHYAMEQLFGNKSFNNSEDLINYFDKGMSLYRSHFTDKEFEDRTLYGHDILKTYFDTYSKSWQPTRTYRPEHHISHTHHRGVPINGVMDLVEVIGDRAYITDFKTGRFDYGKVKVPKKEGDDGSDYWRQIMYYKILMNEDPRSSLIMEKGFMDFVQPDSKNKLNKKEIPLEPKHIAMVSDQIVDTYDKIKNYEFSEGCDDADCRWCELVRE